MIAALLWLSCFAASSDAASPPVDPSAPAEIIVTGERIARPLSKTASSVVVVTGDEIESRAAPDRIEQLLALVPNIQLGSGGEAPSIRGQDATGVLRDLPAFLGGTRPRTTLQVDGRAVSYFELSFGLASIWDVDRVEVFRTPQTTTQGRNSIAGAIFVETRDPGYDWQARARAIAGNYDTRQISAVVSGPIVHDQLAFRIAGDLRHSRSSSDIVDRIAGADPDDDDHGTLRVKLLAEPAAVPGARLEATWSHVESTMPQIEGVRAPFRARRDPADGYGIFHTNVDSLIGVLDLDVGHSLTSKTTVAHGDSDIRRFAMPGLGEARIAARDLSLETLLSWTPAGPFRITGGVHHLQTDLDQAIDLTALRLGRGAFTDEQKSFGVFGEASWHPVGWLGLTAGLRYQQDRQDRGGSLGPSGSGLDLAFNESFHAWLPKLSVEVELAPKVTTGILVLRAYNPGGATLSVETGTVDTFGAESLWDVEAFARLTLDGGRLRLAANLFHYAMHDAQRPQTQAVQRPDGSIVFRSEIANAPEATSSGIELEASWQVHPRLSIALGVGLLSTDIARTLLPTDPIRGKDFQRSPALSASGEMDWRPVDPIRLSAQLRQNAAYFSDDANTPSLRVGSATVADARASYEAGPVTMFAYVRNIFNALYKTQLFTPDFGTLGDPRELGLGIEARF